MSNYVNHYGVSLKINPLIMSEKMISVIKDKTYESGEAKELDRIIQEDEVVLEIGAGIGFISALIARNNLVRRVVSYEANPFLIEAIVDNVGRNVKRAAEKWEVRNAVLKNGPAMGDVDFFIDQDFWASSLAPIKHPKSIEKIKVENFNSVTAELNPSLIVCDIEGGEFALFKNADLTGVKKVYLEVHQSKLGRRGMRDLFNMFHARDFHYDQHHSHGSVILFSHLRRDEK